MIVLNRESIIEGLIEIRKEEDLENSIIVNNIKSIIDLNDISNLDKLKLINNELGKYYLMKLYKYLFIKIKLYSYQVFESIRKYRNDC